MRTLRWIWRQMTWRLRSLPQLIIIGAQKSGTTSLFHYMAQHPHMVPSVTKEVHFFDGGLDPTVDTFKKGERWYRSHFPEKRSLSASHQVFEASPSYLLHPEAPGRIRELIPDVRIIALLRNPVERAISHYFHEKRKGREPLPLYEALIQEEERLAPVLAARDFKSPVFNRFSYKLRGIYKPQLDRYYGTFAANQMLVLSGDRLFQQPGNVLQEVFDFVGVDPGVHIGDLAARNAAPNKRPVEDRVYAYLEEFFAPHNRELQEALGINFGWEGRR